MFKSSCENQICPHPRCWYNNRINENNLNKLNYKIYKEGCVKYPTKLKNTKSVKSYEENEKGFLPTLKVVNISQFTQQTENESKNVQLFKRRAFDHKAPVDTPYSSLSHKTLDSGSATQDHIVYEHLKKIRSLSRKCQRVDLSLDERFQNESFRKCLIWVPSTNYKSEYLKDDFPPKTSRLKYADVGLNEFQPQPKQVLLKRKNIPSKKNIPTRTFCSKNINNDYFKLSKSTNVEELCRLKPKTLQKVLLKAVDQNLITKKQSQLLIFQINSKTYGCNLSNYKNSNKLGNNKNEMRNKKILADTVVRSNHLSRVTKSKRNNCFNLQEKPRQKETIKQINIDARSFDPVITNINHNQSNLPKEKPTIVVSNVLCDEKISSKENSDCNLSPESPIINKIEPHLLSVDQNCSSFNGFVVNQVKKQKVKSAMSSRIMIDFLHPNLSRSKSFTASSIMTFKKNISPRTPPSSPQ